MLGRAIVSYCSHNAVDIVTFDRKKYNEKYGNIIDLNGADVIIHAGANTNVEECELSPIAAYQDNTILTDLLARSAKTQQAKFVYISSTGVYGDTTKMPHIETQKPCPCTTHHLSKYFGELVVSSLCEHYLILRLGWLYGGPLNLQKNFVGRIIKQAKDSPFGISSNIDQVGNPTFVDDVVLCLFKLLDCKHSGVFNCVNEGVMTRYEYVKNIVCLYGLGVKVSPVSADSFNRVAPVSMNEGAINHFLSQKTNIKMPPAIDSLQKYIKGLLPA